VNDRPLTDAQERALIRLVSISGRHEGRGWFRTSRFCRSTTTATVLARLGLVELRFAPQLHFGIARLSGSQYEARVTAAGREMLDSMGD
jgi:hypothetical protein